MSDTPTVPAFRLYTQFVPNGASKGERAYLLLNDPTDEEPGAEWLAIAATDEATTMAWILQEVYRIRDSFDLRQHQLDALMRLKNELPSRRRCYYDNGWTTITKGVVNRTWKP